MCLMFCGAPCRAEANVMANVMTPLQCVSLLQGKLVNSGFLVALVLGFLDQRYL